MTERAWENRDRGDERCVRQTDPSYAG